MFLSTHGSATPAEYMADQEQGIRLFVSTLNPMAPISLQFKLWYVIAG